MSEATLWELLQKLEDGETYFDSRMSQPLSVREAEDLVGLAESLAGGYELVAAMAQKEAQRARKLGLDESASEWDARASMAQRIAVANRETAAAKREATDVRDACASLEQTIASMEQTIATAKRETADIRMREHGPQPSL